MDSARTEQRLCRDGEVEGKGVGQRGDSFRKGVMHEGTRAVFHSKRKKQHRHPSRPRKYPYPEYPSIQQATEKWGKWGK